MIELESMSESNFLGIEKEFTNLGTAAHVVLPIPFEKTTSYGKGTAKGPAAIISASHFVEFYDEVYNIEAFRSGIATLPPVSTDDKIEDIFKRITDKISELLHKNKFIVCLGGEHSISAPVFEAYNTVFENLSIIQFDAHSDLRESYEGSKFSHASVMYRIWEMNPKIVQVGIRSQCIEEADLIKKEGINTIYAHDLAEKGFRDEIIENLSGNVFITFDVDYFDPSIMPSTGTPEPGGFQWNETVKFLEKIFNKRNVVGCDVVELSPNPDLTHPDFLAAKLVYKMITLKELTKK
jgi:agmatinase